MTGSEIPIIKAVAAGAKEVLGDDGERASLQEVAKDSRHFESAAEMYAKRVEIKQAALLKLYQPIGRLLGASKEYFREGFHNDMAKKLAAIPDEELRSPSPSVAIPALEGLQYSFGEPDLKDMYLNLLATATDQRTQHAAHPSFAGIIKDLSPNEAQPLLDLLRMTALPVARLRIRSALGRGFNDGASNLTPAQHTSDGARADEETMATWIDNWVRLGLIEISWDRHISGETAYDWVDQSPAYLRDVAGQPRGKTAVSIEKGVVTPTTFGRRFLQAVSFDGIHISALHPDGQDSDPVDNVNEQNS